MTEEEEEKRGPRGRGEDKWAWSEGERRASSNVGRPPEVTRK